MEVLVDDALDLPRGLPGPTNVKQNAKLLWLLLGLVDKLAFRRWLRCQQIVFDTNIVVSVK
jgi:hypothetical protein